MFDSTFQARYAALFDVRISERRNQFPAKFAQIDAQATAYGMFRSSGRILQMGKAHEQELASRSAIAWDCLTRVHRTLGSPMSDTLRDDLKEEMARRITECSAELNWSLSKQIKKSDNNASFSLDETRIAEVAKHNIEIDLYVDSLSESLATKGTTPMTQNYNFYGNIGAVQTGANSTANVIQNLTVDERASISSALQQVKEALSDAPSIADTQRYELLDIANDCVSQMALESPNTIKLLTMLTVLGTSIQSIASAQPAYQALKVALLPLGITFP